MANNPLVGAWELVSDSDAGILIYTGSLCVLVGSPKNRRRSTGNQVTPDEAVEAIRSCPAMAGTYTVSGSRITHTRIANSRAEVSGRPLFVDYSIDGNTLTYTVVSGAGTAAAGSSTTFRRIGSNGVGGPLLGAWELVNDERQGVIILTETHCAVVQMYKNRSLPSGDQYTPEEALEAITTCGAFSATYSVSGNTVSAERIANLRPTAVGVTGVMEFAVEGDTLNLRGISGGLPTEEWTWRKVG